MVLRRLSKEIIPYGISGVAPVLEPVGNIVPGVLADIRRRSGYPVEKMIEIKAPRCLLLLTPAELTALLARDPELWRRAIRRGKLEKRTRSTEARERRQVWFSEEKPYCTIPNRYHGRPLERKPAKAFSR